MEKKAKNIKIMTLTDKLHEKKYKKKSRIIKISSKIQNIVNSDE